MLNTILCYKKTLVNFFRNMQLTNISDQVDENVPLSKKISVKKWLKVSIHK